MEQHYQKIQHFTNILLKSLYKAGLSQEFIAKQLNVTKKTVQNWENGLSFLLLSKP